MLSMSMPNADTFFGVRRHRDEMIGDGILAERLDEPGAGRAGVGERLDGRERLRRDDEQRRCRVEAASTAAMSAPSMLETRRQRRRMADAASAPVAIAGPRSEPPMPMLTTSVIRSSARGSGRRRRPSGRAPRAPRRRRHAVDARRPPAGARSAVCSTARSSVTLICSPANIAAAARLDASGAATSSRAVSMASSTAFLE